MYLLVFPVDREDLSTFILLADSLELLYSFSGFFFFFFFFLLETRTTYIFKVFILGASTQMLYKSH